MVVGTLHSVLEGGRCCATDDGGRLVLFVEVEMHGARTANRFLVESVDPRRMTRYNLTGDVSDD